MKNVWTAGLMVAAMTMGQAAIADETVDAVGGIAAGMAGQKVSDATGGKVELSSTGDVKINSGNALLDAAANQSPKCAEKLAAKTACDKTKGLAAMMCQQAADKKYKDVECPTPQ